MTIIEANTSHLSLLIPLFDGYRVFYKQESNPQLAERFLTDRFELKESIIFLAIDDQNGKGIGFTQLYPTFSSVSAERYYILNDLYVRPENRGQGVGAALLQRAKQLVLDKDMKGLALSTATDNPAQKLYEKLGWEKDRDFLHYFWSATTGHQ